MPGRLRRNPHPRLLGNVNGGSHTDIVAYGDRHVAVLLGRSDGVFDPPQPVVNDLAYEAGGWRVLKHPRLLGNVNGGSHTDIVAYAVEAPTLLDIVRRPARFSSLLPQRSTSTF